jgi:hypothetical protein
MLIDDEDDELLLGQPTTAAAPLSPAAPPAAASKPVAAAVVRSPPMKRAPSPTRDAAPREAEAAAGDATVMHSRGGDGIDKMARLAFGQCRITVVNTGGMAKPKAAQIRRVEPAPVVVAKPAVPAAHPVEVTPPRAAVKQVATPTASAATTPSTVPKPALPAAATAAAPKAAAPVLKKVVLAKKGVAAPGQPRIDQFFSSFKMAPKA